MMWVIPSERSVSACCQDVTALPNASRLVAKKAFTSYQVNEELFARALPEAIFMHCLPARRGEEVIDAVMENPRSAVFDQAENRLHAHKALLLMMLSGN